MVWRYAIGKYLYMSAGSGLILRYKKYAIKTEEDNLES